MRYSVHAQVTNTNDNGDKEMGTDEPSKMMEVRMKMIVVLSTGNLTVKVVIQNQVPQGPVNIKAALQTKVLENLVKVQN